MVASLAEQPADPEASPPSSDAAPLPPPEPRREPAGPGRAARVGFWLYATHLWALFGIALSNGLAGLMLLAAPWAAAPWAAGRLRQPRSRQPLHRQPLHLGTAGRVLYAALAAYVLFLLVAIAASYQPATSLRAASELFTLATLALGPLLVRGERQVRRVVDGIVVVGGLVALHGLGQLFFGYGEIDRRIRGPFSHWMTFSGFLLVCDLLLIAALLFRHQDSREAGAPRPAGWRGWRVVPRGWRLLPLGWRLAALVAINAALLVSLTRSAWVGLALALGLGVLLRSPRALLLVPPAAVLFVVLAPVPMLHRVASITDLRDSSNYDRLCMAEAGLLMIAESPWTGIGPEMVKHRYPIYRHPTATRYWVPHLHNSFLQLAAERGLPALAAYLALLAASLAAAWGGYRREGGRRGPRADLWLGALLALIGFNLAGLFEHNWGDTEVQRLVLFLLALPFCLRAGGAAAANPASAPPPR